MDTFGKMALVAGSGLLIGAAIQKASDNYVRDRVTYEEEHQKLEDTVRSQKEEIRDLRRTVERLEKRT